MGYLLQIRVVFELRSWRGGWAFIVDRMLVLLSPAPRLHIYIGGF